MDYSWRGACTQTPLDGMAVPLALEPAGASSNEFSPRNLVQVLLYLLPRYINNCIPMPLIQSSTITTHNTQ